MKLNKTYKYKLKLASTQERQVISWFHTCRAMYNLALDTKVYAYRSNKVSLSAYEGKKILVVNVASKCGYTKQYKPLEEVYNKKEPTNHCWFL